MKVIYIKIMKIIWGHKVFYSIFRPCFWGYCNNFLVFEQRKVDWLLYIKKRFSYLSDKYLDYKKL